MKQDRKPPRYMYQIRNIEYYAREGRLQPQTISSGQYEVFPSAGNPKIFFWVLNYGISLQSANELSYRMSPPICCYHNNLRPSSDFILRLHRSAPSATFLNSSRGVLVIWLANIKISHGFPYVFNHSSIHSFIHWMNELMAIFDPKIHSFIYWWLIKLRFIPP